MQCLCATTDLISHFCEENINERSKIKEEKNEKNNINIIETKNKIRKETDIKKKNTVILPKNLTQKINFIDNNQKNIGILELFRNFIQGTRQLKQPLYDPSLIYNKAIAQCPHFRAHSQQDAQELLRFFLGFISY